MYTAGFFLHLCCTTGCTSLAAALRLRLSQLLLRLLLLLSVLGLAAHRCHLLFFLQSAAQVQYRSLNQQLCCADQMLLCAHVCGAGSPQCNKQDSHELVPAAAAQPWPLLLHLRLLSRQQQRQQAANSWPQRPSAAQCATARPVRWLQSAAAACPPTCSSLAGCLQGQQQPSQTSPICNPLMHMQSRGDTSAPDAA